MLVNLNHLFSIYWIHCNVFLFCLFTLKQIYLFKVPEILFLNQIYLVKINLFNRLESIFPLSNYFENNSVIINTNVFNLINMCNNNSIILYKSISEKKFYLIENSLNELLNSNLNVLMQPLSLILFTSIILFLFWFKSFFFLKTSIFI